ncbi:hypothetical protein BH09BAC3_BH09BAC3_33550 [soil metagenome]
MDYKSLFVPSAVLRMGRELQIPTNVPRDAIKCKEVKTYPDQRG